MALTTTGLIAEWYAGLADSGTTVPTNPSDLTWDCLTNSSYDGTLTNFDAAMDGDPEGWYGAGSESDPYSLAIGGGNNIVLCGGASDFNSIANLSIDGWIYVPSTLANSFPRIIDKSDTSSTGFAAYLDAATGYLGVVAKVGTELADENGFVATDMRTAGWHYFCIAFDGNFESLARIRGWVDSGTQGGGYNFATSGNLASSTCQVALGNRSTANDRAFTGRIAVVRLYNITLSATQVADNLAAGKLATTGSLGDAPTVTTTSITSITANTASGGGTVTDQGDAALSAYGVCWNTTGSPTTSDSKTVDGPS